LTFLAASSFSKPVVLFYGAIGDTLLALPALRALCHVFPRGLVLICDRIAYDLCYHDLSVEMVCFLEMDLWAKPSTVQATISREIGHCDLLLSLVPWRWEGLDLVVKALRPSVTVGLNEGVDVPILRSWERHAFDFAFAVPRIFNPSLDIEHFTQSLPLKAAARREAAAIVSLLPPGRRMLAVHVETEDRKTWSVSRLREALVEFLRRHPDYWAVTLGVRRPTPPTVWRGLRIAPCEGLALAPSMALLRLADAFLGVDSCMLHAADLFRIPGVGLFGPTRVSEFGFRLARHRCVDGGGSMEGVLPESAVEALDALLTEIA